MARTHTPLKATLWSFVERFSQQGIAFVLGIILARLLSPYDYGLVGLISIFLVLSNVFIDSGFGNGLIRKPERTENDLSTAFYFNILVGVSAYFVLWVCSPVIAWYFDEPILIALVRICGLNVILNSLCIVQTVILTINLNIRLQTIISICSQIPAGIFAIYLAYNGYGVYALALQTVTASAIKVVLLWGSAKWRPRDSFSKNSFTYLWGFGSKLLGATLIGTFFDQVYSILIGKYIGKNELGYYTKSSNLKDNVTGITSGIITKVSLPILTKYQKDRDILCEKFREMMKLLVMMIAPISAVLCFSSEDIIIFLWSEKWLPSAFLFQLLIISSMFVPIGQLSLILLQVVGRTGLILKLELPKKSIYCILIAVGFLKGVVGLCIALIGINIVGALINMFATKKILNYSYVAQLSDIILYMIIAYLAGWVSTFFMMDNMHVFNILMTFVIVSLVYIFVLFVIRDRTMLTILTRSIKYLEK